MIEKITAKMIEFYQGERSSIAHFLKVYAYARTIGQLERLDENTQAILDIAAIVHDIACPTCWKKYGSAAGNLQEQESEALLRPFLAEFSLTDAMRERIITLVCRHHTYTDVDGPDCQILLEADYLVNADEGNISQQAIQAFRDSVFRAESGIRLLNSIFLCVPES